MALMPAPRGRQRGPFWIGIGDDFLRRLRRIFIVACGTSYHAGLIVSYAIEQLRACPCSSTWPASSAIDSPSSTRTHWSSASRSPARRPIRWLPCGLAREAGSPVLALTTSWAARPRATPTRAVHARRAGDRRGGHQDAHRPGRRAAAAGAAPGRARGAQTEDGLKRLGHELRASARRWSSFWPRTPRRSGSPGATTTSVLPVPGARHGLRRVPGGRAQAQGDQLHPHRGLRRRRDEARPIALLDDESPSWWSPTTAHLPQADEQHPGGPRARRRRDRRGHRGQRRPSPSCRATCCGCPATDPAGADPRRWCRCSPGLRHRRDQAGSTWTSRATWRRPSPVEWGGARAYPGSPAAGRRRGAAEGRAAPRDGRRALSAAPPLEP